MASDKILLVGFQTYDLFNMVYRAGNKLAKWADASLLGVELSDEDQRAIEHLAERYSQLCEELDARGEWENYKAYREKKESDIDNK